VRQRFVSILLLTLACAAAALTVLAQPPGPTNGSYNCIVAGDFTGDGNISSGGNGTTIMFALQVRDKAGNRGELRATVSVVKNRFSGEGSVMGYPMKIQGRLDPADQGGRQQQLRGQRLVATFSDDSRRHGRITGSPLLRNGNGGGGGGGGGDDHDN